MDKEYIEHDVVINNIDELFTICRETLLNECGHHFVVEKELQTHLDFVRNMPAADVRPVVRGEWIKDEYKWTCSNCGEDFSFYDNAFLHDGCYCPNCGADMREKNRCVTT